MKIKAIDEEKLDDMVIKLIHHMLSHPTFKNLDEDTFIKRSKMSIIFSTDYSDEERDYMCSALHKGDSYLRTFQARNQEKDIINKAYPSPYFEAC